LKHFLFFHILEFSSAQLTFIFSGGVETTNQFVIGYISYEISSFNPYVYPHVSRLYPWFMADMPIACHSHFSQLNIDYTLW
jgi:hypothetical protein